jgi:hypothetical protein
VLFIDDKPVDQSVHGNYFWQTDYDTSAQRWQITFNIPAAGDAARMIRLAKSP